MKNIKPLIWDDNTKEEHVYKCVSVAYVDLPVQGDWKSHIAICDEGRNGFTASVWLMNGGIGISNNCSSIEDAKFKAEEWWKTFVNGFLYEQ
jgi:hypothetical protein